MGEIGDQSFTVSFTPADTNYNEVTGIPVTVSVGKATYDMNGVTFADATYTYDGGMKSISILGTLPEGVTVRYENDTRVNAGSNTVTALFSGDSEHYNDIPSLTATLTINKKNIVITANSAESVYGQDLAPLTATADLAVGDEASTVYTLEKAEGLNAGTYAITVNVIPNGNYNVTQTIAGTYTIQKATYDMSGVFFDGGQFTYDGNAKSLAIQNALPDGVTVEYEGNDQIDADTYTVTAHFTGDADNYNLIEDKTATLTILQAEIEGLSFLDASATYDGADHTIEVTGMPQGANVVYSISNTQKNADTYEVTATVSVNDPNYLEAVLTATLVIYPKQITITGDTIRSTYGEDLLPLTATVAEGIVTGDDPASIYTLAKEAGLNAGVYDIVVTLVDNVNPNYTVYQAINGTYIIDKATYNMTNVSFSDKTLTYDGAEHSLTVTGILPDGITVRYSNNTRTNAGSMDVTAVFFGDYDNYCEVESMTATLTIDKANAFLDKTNMVSRFTYDGKPHTIEGLVASGDISLSQNNFTCVTNGAEVIVTVSENENYYGHTFYEDPILFYIDPATLTVTIDDATINYGDSAEDLSFTITGYVNGEDQSIFSIEPYCSAEYNEGDNAGAYPIGLIFGTPDNYTVTYTPGTLTVNKIAPTLTVTAADKKQNDTPAAVGVNTNSNGGITYLYKVTGADDSTYTDVAPTEIGNYTVKAVLAEGTNYLAATATAEYRITAKAIPVITFAGNFGKTYDGQPIDAPAYTVTDEDDNDIMDPADITVEYKKATESDGSYSTANPTNAGDYVVRVSSAANDVSEAGSATLAFTISKATPQDIDAPDGLTAMYGQKLSEIELPTNWAWDSPNDAVGNVGNNNHSATYTPSDQNYEAVQDELTISVEKANYPHPTELNIYLADPNMTTAELSAYLPEGWVISENTIVLEKLRLYGTKHDDTHYSVLFGIESLADDNHVDQNPTDNNNYTVRVHVWKYEPTVTFTGSLDAIYNGYKTAVNVPETESDSRLSFGTTPTDPNYLFAGEDIQAKQGQNVIVKFIAAADYTGTAQAESYFTSTQPQTVGSYVCRIKISDWACRFGGYVDVPFEISKCTPTITFLNEDVTCTIAAPGNDVDYLSARATPDGLTRVYSYKSLGADGILNTADDGEWSTVLPRVAGKYQVRCSVEATDNTNAAEAYTQITLVKKQRIDLYLYVRDNGVFALGNANTAYVNNPNDSTSGIVCLFEYKPDGSADSAYTTDLPKKPGKYTLRVTVPETDMYEASYLTENITFKLLEPTYFYKGEDFTFVFAKTDLRGSCDILYVYEGRHTIEECTVLEYVSYTENFDIDEINLITFVTCYEDELMLELVDEDSGELVPVRFGTPLYVYHTLRRDFPVTLSFNDLGGTLRVFMCLGAYTLAEVAEQGNRLSPYYLGDWYYTTQEGMIYTYVYYLDAMWFTVGEDGETLTRNVGEVIYTYQREKHSLVKGVRGLRPDGEEKEYETLAFCNVFGKNYVLIYPGAYTKDTLSSAEPILVEAASWYYQEGADCVIYSDDGDSFLFGIEKDDTLTLLDANYNYQGYAYYYDIRNVDSEGAETEYCTFTVFLNSNGTEVFVEPWQDGVPAAPVTYAEYMEYCEESYGSATWGNRTVVTNVDVKEYDRGEIRLGNDFNISLYRKSFGHYSLREDEVAEWYAFTRQEEDADPVTELFWKASDGMRYYERIDGGYAAEYVMRAAPGNEDNYNWKVTNGYLLDCRSKVRAIGSKVRRMFNVNGHTLTETELGEYDYMFSKNEGDEDDPDWYTFLFYTFGSNKYVFLLDVDPEELVLPSTVNELLNDDNYDAEAIEWEEDAGYVYISAWGGHLAFVKGTDGSLTAQAAPTVEYMFVDENDEEDPDDDETFAYLILGNRGYNYCYYDEGALKTKEELEAYVVAYGIDCFGYEVATWERLTDESGTYIIGKKDDNLSVCKVVEEENGAETFDTSMAMYGTRLYYVNEIYSDGYYNGTLLFSDIGGRMIVYFAYYGEPLTPENEATSVCGYVYPLGYGVVDEETGVIGVCRPDGVCLYTFDPVSGALVDMSEKIPLYFCSYGGDTIVFSETRNGKRCISLMEGEAKSLADVASLTELQTFFGWEYGDSEHTFIVFGGSEIYIIPFLGGRLFLSLVS